VRVFKRYEDIYKSGQTSKKINNISPSLNRWLDNSKIYLDK
jgi:hypothetical protein